MRANGRWRGLTRSGGATVRNTDWTQLSEEERVRRALQLIDLAKGAMEKKRLLEAGPPRIVYDPTDGDELADREAARRRTQPDQDKDAGFRAECSASDAQPAVGRIQ